MLLCGVLAMKKCTALWCLVPKLMEKSWSLLWCWSGNEHWQHLRNSSQKTVIGYSGNGWMDEQQLNAEYLHCIIGSFSFKRRLLVCDSYQWHATNSIKQQLVRIKVDTAGMSAGCWKFIQPADFSWNKSFKSKYTEKYDKWMANDNHEYITSGRMHAPPMEEIVKWINESWSEIP